MRRVLLVIPNALLLTALLFVSITTLMGSPALLMLGQDASPEAVRQLNERYGFDKPIFFQYYDWLTAAFQGDFGRSFATQQPVSEMIGATLPITIELSLWSILVAVCLAVTLNTVPYARRGVEAISATLSVIGITTPNFSLGVGLIFLFSVKLGWLPTTGWIAWKQGIGPHFAHLILPVITVMAFYFASFSIVYLAEYRNVSKQIYIKVAKSKGLTATRVSFRHIMPNSVMPVITYAGLSLGQLVGGAVVTETVFSLPGIGRLLVSAIGARDFPVILAIGMLLVIGVMVANLIADLTYSLVNPLVRHS
jgi:peptide/nickel transport system permease protein